MLLLDEPSSSLSRPELAAFTETLSSAFDNADGGPLTIVETSHSVERERQADRVVRLADGAVVSTPPGGAVDPPSR
jgi:energy-coupling factor transporter ATP-binding protein EcfA2